MAKLVRHGIVVGVGAFLVLFLFSNYEPLTSSFPDFRLGFGTLYMIPIPTVRLVYLLFGFFLGGFLVTWVACFTEIWGQRRENGRLRRRLAGLEKEIAGLSRIEGDRAGGSPPKTAEMPLAESEDPAAR